MKRILLTMSQPPGCNGVQAVMFAKLLPYLEAHGWEFHFAGPDPSLDSVLPEALSYPAERLHYTDQISASRIFSIRRNRAPRGSVARYWFGVLQLLAKLSERLRRHDSERYLQAGIASAVRQADATWNFDLLAGLSPGFSFLVLVSQLAREQGKPFFAFYTDPHGARQEDAFYPSAPELQQAILDQACGVLFTSPLTRARYVAAGLVPGEKAFFFTESYPESPELYVSGRSELATATTAKERNAPLQMVYLGMLPEWRPAEPLLDALAAYGQAGADHRKVELRIYGYLYPAARSRIQATPELARMVQIHPSVSYAQSHWLAEDASIQLVLIGPRHIDNLPSKFFDYLAHHKPVLVLGPHQNPVRTIIEELGIGRYVDGLDSDAIGQALADITTNYASYQAAFALQQERLLAYGASAGAQWICEVMDRSLEREETFRASR